MFLPKDMRLFPAKADKLGNVLTQIEAFGGMRPNDCWRLVNWHFGS